MILATVDVATIVTLIGAIAAAITSIIAAWRSGQTNTKVDAVHGQLQLPSNGTSIGAGVEAIGQKQDMAIGLAHPGVDGPSFVQLARQLDPSNPNIAPQRRSDDPTAPPTPEAP